MKHDIDSVIVRIAPPRGPGRTPGAGELFEEITTVTAATADPAAVPSGPARFPRVRRLGRAAASRRGRLVLPLAALVIALSWLVPGVFGLGARPASAALDIKQEGGYYIVTVKDVFADPKIYQAQLHEHGLDISLKLSPASPSLVGQMLVADPKMNGLTNAEMAHRKDLIVPIESQGCASAPVPCTIGVKVPVGYQGKATIYLGRQARPGEAYRSMAPIDGPGEVLHCVDFRMKTVDQVVAILKERGVPNVGFATAEGPRSSVPGSWIVHDGVMSAADRALLLVGPTLKRPDAPGPDMAGNFCPKGTS
jgi:hypothetical protein